MPLRRRPTYAIRACILALALLGVTAPARPALARPSSAEVTPVISQALASVTATVGVSSVTVTPGTPAMPNTGGFSYNATVRLLQDAQSVTVRLKILNPSGKLMIQQTRIANNAKAGTVLATFERDMSDLQLGPGAYPVRVEVRIAQAGQIAEETVETDLLVYDQTRARLPVVACARIVGQPLADPQGRFVSDPAQYTQARDDVNGLAAWVLTDRDAHLTLGVSPLLLREWARIAAGYELVGPEGTTRVAVGSPTPAAYAATLELLNDAIETGRLELTTQGYADPDLAALAAHGMVSDVDAQYAAGWSALSGSIEASSSTGTIPAGGCLPPEAGSALARHGVGYAVIDQSCARFKRSNAAPGLYRVDGPPIRILVADDELTSLVSKGDTNAQLRYAFDRAIAAGSRGPLTLNCEVGPGALSTEALITAVEALGDQPWLKSRLARDVVSRVPASTVKLLNGSEDEPAPKGYWSDVREARAWSAALSAALGAEEPEPITVEDDSLIAQCSAWAGTDGRWTSADRGRAFTNAALRSSREILSAVSVRVESMTLAGNTGEVPATVTNAGHRPLTVDVITTGGRGVSVVGDRSRRVVLSPKDNFVELPVSMPNALQGRLTVTVSSGGVILDRETIDVRASYLDRLAVVGGVVVLLVMMLVFIVRRVRSSESTEDSDGS